MTIKLPPQRRIPPQDPIIGRVLELDGRPAAGVELLFSVRRFGRGAGPFFPVDRATADESGEFVVPALDESAILRVTVMSPGVTARAKEIDLISRLRLRLRGPKRVVHYGRRFELAGSVSGDLGAQTGRRATVQAIAGGRWRDVGEARIKKDGRIRWRYRLRHTRRPSNYRFRMRIRQWRDTPWSRVTSRAVTVRIRP